MKARQIKKLNKKAMLMFIRCGWCCEDDFYLSSNDWVLQIHHQSREEYWYDEAQPFNYLVGLAQETLVEYVEVKDNSKLGFHIKEVWSRDCDLSTIDAFKIFRSTYVVKQSKSHY